jgi:hypothetical protein
MPYMLVRHKVADYNKWKPVFDGHKPVQQKAGLKLVRVMRNSENSNETFVLFEVSDIKKAQEFGASDDLRETMMKAGVVDKPDVYFLN